MGGVCLCLHLCRPPADTLILSLRALAGVAREANQGLPKEAGQSPNGRKCGEQN